MILISFVNAQDLYPTTIGESLSEITLRGSGNINGLKTGEEVKFQTLTFQNTQYQEIQTIKEELFINDKIIKPTYSYDEFDNKYVNFLIKENGDFNYHITVTIKRISIIHEIEDYNVEETN